MSLKRGSASTSQISGPSKVVSFSEDHGVTMVGISATTTTVGGGQPSEVKDAASKELTQKLRKSKQVKRLIEEARSMDQKTIQELAKEVKRLTNLLPRYVVEEEEGNIHNINHSDGQANTLDSLAETKIPTFEENNEDNKRSQEKTIVAQKSIIFNELGLKKPDEDTVLLRCWAITKFAVFIFFMLCILFVLLIELIPSFLLSD